MLSEEEIRELRDRAVRDITARLVLVNIAVEAVDQLQNTMAMEDDNGLVEAAIELHAAQKYYQDILSATRKDL